MKRKRTGFGVVGCGVVIAFLAVWGGVRWWNAPPSAPFIPEPNRVLAHKGTSPWGSEFAPEKQPTSEPLTPKQKTEIAFNKRLNEYRKRKGIMPNNPNFVDIARGTTGQAPERQTSFVQDSSTRIIVLNQGSMVASNEGNGGQGMGGWAVTSSGQITVPSNASSGIYTAYYPTTIQATDSNGHSGYAMREFTFEVVPFKAVVKVSNSAFGPDSYEKTTPAIWNESTNHWKAAIEGQAVLPVSYVWDNGNTNAQWSETATGEMTRTCTITDASGESSSDSAGVYGYTGSLGGAYEPEDFVDPLVNGKPIDTQNVPHTARWSEEHSNPQNFRHGWWDNGRGDDSIEHAWEERYEVPELVSHTLYVPWWAGGGYRYENGNKIEVPLVTGTMEKKAHLFLLDPNATAPRLLLAANPTRGVSAQTLQVDAKCVNVTGNETFECFVDGVSRGTQTADAATGVTFAPVITLPDGVSTQDYAVKVTTLGGLEATQGVTVRAPGYVDPGDPPAPVAALRAYAEPANGKTPLATRIIARLENSLTSTAARDYTMAIDGVSRGTKSGTDGDGVFWDEVLTCPAGQNSKTFQIYVSSGAYSQTFSVVVSASDAGTTTPYLRLDAIPESGKTPLSTQVSAHIENAADPAATLDYQFFVDGGLATTRNATAGRGTTFFPTLVCPSGQTSKTYLVAVEAGGFTASQSVTVYRASTTNPPPPDTPPSDTTRLALEVVPGTGETPLSTQILARFLDAAAPLSTQEFKTYVEGALIDTQTQPAGQGIAFPYEFTLPANLTAKTFVVRVESGGYAATQNVFVRRIAPPATGSPSLRVVAVPTSGKSPLSTQLSARIDNAANPNANTSFEYFLDGVSQSVKNGAASSGVSWNVPLDAAAGKTSQTFALRVTSGSLEETQNVTAYQSGVGVPEDPGDPPGVIYRCPAPPAAPAAPTLQGIDCGAHSVTLESPDFPADNATRPDPTRDILLWRLPKDGNPNAGAHFVGLFAATGATLTDDGVISPSAYDYYAQARNERGLSEYSAKLAVSLASPLTVEFLAPANETLRGFQQVAVKVQGGGVGIGAVHVFYNGSELAMQPASADATVFWCDFDTDADARQGTVTLSAYVVDANGCRSPLVKVTRVLDNSLRFDVRWLEIRRTWTQVAAGVQVYAKMLLAQFAGARDDNAIEFGILSSAPAAPLPTETPYTQAQLDALDDDWLNWKKIRLDAPESVPRAGEPNAKGEYSEGCKTVTLRARSQRLRRVSRFDVEAPIQRFVVQEAKAAQGQTPATPARVLAYSTQGARIYEYSESGVWKLLYDLSTQFPNAHSVAMRADKIYFVNEGRAVAYDVNVGEAAYTGAAMGESKPAVACEYWPGADAIVWAHSNLHDGSTLWMQQGDQVKKLADDLPFVSLLRAAGDTLAFLTDFSVWTVQKGAAPIERYTSLTDAALFVSPQTSGDVIFSADKTWVLASGASTPLLLDDRDFLVRGYATHGQNLSTPLPVIGGASTQLYRREPVAPDQAAFVPFLNLNAGESVRALAAAKFGDVDTLFVAVEDGESGHVLRVQSIAPASHAYRAADIEQIVMSPTQYV